MQQCAELVRAMTPIVKGCTLKNMLRAEVEPWVPNPTNKKGDNSNARMSKGERS